MACADGAARAQSSLAHRVLDNGGAPFLGAVPVVRPGYGEPQSLGVRAYGRGVPVVFLPGMCNSRLFNAAWEKTEQLAVEAGVRVVQVDRLGVGISSAPAAADYTEFARVMASFADVLRLERFSLLAYSSGGPFAMACAAEMGPRVASLHLVAPDGPYQTDAELRGFMPKMYGSEQPLTMQGALDRAAFVVEHFRETYRSVPNPARSALALADIDHAVSLTLDGAARDGYLETHPFSFDLSRVTCPTTIFHGDQDQDVPVHVSVRLASVHLSSVPRVPVPGLELLRVVHGETHAIIRRVWGQALAAAATCFKQEVRASRC